MHGFYLGLGLDLCAFIATVVGHVGIYLVWSDHKVFLSEKVAIEFQLLRTGKLRSELAGFRLIQHSVGVEGKQVQT